MQGADGKKSENEDEEKKREASADKPSAEDQPKKKKAKINKKRLTVIASDKPWVLSSSQLNELVEVEANLALADKREKEKNDARNALEEYIYDMRDKLGI